MRVITTKNKQLKKLIQNGNVCLISTTEKLIDSMKSVLISFEISSSKISMFRNYEQAHSWILENIDQIKLIVADYEIHGIYAINYFKELKKLGQFPRVESVICRNKYQDEIVRKSNLSNIPTICSPYRPNKFIQKIFEAADELMYPSSLKICSQLIKNNIDENKFTRAKDMALEAIKKEPNFVPGYYYLGRIHLQLEQYSESISFFEMGLKLSGNNLFCLEGLFDVHKMRNNHEEALSMITKICLIYPLSSKRINDYLNLVLLVKDFKELLVLEKILNYQKKIRTTFIFEKKFKTQPLSKTFSQLDYIPEQKIIGPSNNIIEEFEDFVQTVDMTTLPQEVFEAEYQTKKESTRTLKDQFKVKNFDRKLSDFKFYQNAISNSDKITSLKLLDDQFTQLGYSEIPYKILYQIEKIFTAPKINQDKINEISTLESLLAIPLGNKSIAKGTRLRLQHDGILGETPSLEKTEFPLTNNREKIYKILSPNLAEEVLDAMEKNNKVIVQTDQNNFIGKFARIEHERIVLKNENDISIVFQSPFNIKNIRPIDEKRYPSFSALKQKLPQLLAEEINILIEDILLEVFYIDTIYDGKYRGFKGESLILENSNGTIFKLEKPKLIKSVKKKYTTPFQYQKNEDETPDAVSSQKLTEETLSRENHLDHKTQSHDFTLSNIQIPIEKLMDTRTDLSDVTGTEQEEKKKQDLKNEEITTEIKSAPTLASQFDNGIMPDDALLIEETPHSKFYQIKDGIFVILIDQNLLNLFDKFIANFEKLNSHDFKTIKLQTQFRKFDENTYYLIFEMHNAWRGEDFIKQIKSQKIDFTFSMRTKFNRLKNHLFYELKEYLHTLGIYLDTSVDNFWFIDSSMDKILLILEKSNEDILTYLREKIIFSIPISYRESPPPVLPNADNIIEDLESKAIN